MRRLLLLTIAVLHATAVAQARPSTLDMSCAEAAATVASYGAAVLTTGEFTYDRFVAHNGFCLPTETVKPAYAPTFDAESCNLGYVCEEERRIPDDGF
ncbi:MAG: hypothetical protein ACRED5_23025 [Propylenella sp.]